MQSEKSIFVELRWYATSLTERLITWWWYRKETIYAKISSNGNEITSLDLRSDCKNQIETTKGEV